MATEDCKNVFSTLPLHNITGKSSRVPIMIMKAPNPDPDLSEVRLFISQPRRIAAKALVERLRATEPELGKQVALRMGHGVREYETSATRAWFVTTGYLVRLMSNHPEKFKKVSHLIIDEIHERSVDTDILCLLCRRLIHTNPHIRLILMSATLAASLYQAYFDIPEPPIKVGVRRFPIEEVFLEDIPNIVRLPPKEIKAVQSIATECHKTRCIVAPSNNTMELLYSLAARIAISVGKPGSSVLIFVPGMRDIEGIVETIEKMYGKIDGAKFYDIMLVHDSQTLLQPETVPGVVYTCIPVHGDIPFEDQMTVSAFVA
jgi:HrpA-like RNA helicase